MLERRADALLFRDLLAEEAFGLELLTGGAPAGDVPVLGAHCVEVESPTRWLARHWVMLTTGVRLRGHADAQRALVDELQTGGATALGFGVGLVFKQVPRALVEAGRERDFPIFAVPFETPFREIVRFVDGALLRDEAQVFRRLTALQRFLVDALRDPEPERSVVERLAGFLDASVAILSEDGTPQIATGEIPVEELWRRIAANPSGLIEVDVEGWHAVATPVAARADRAGRWIVLTSRRHGFIGKLIKPAAETAAPLLSAMALVDDLVHGQEEAAKGALLNEALEPLRPDERPSLAARSATFGVDFSMPARVAVVRRHPRPGGSADPADPNGSAEPADPDGLHRDLVARLERARIPHLVGERADALVLLVQAEEGRLQAVLSAVVGAHAAAVIGVGRPIDTMEAAHHSFRDAELAADRAALDPERRMLRFEDFDVGTFVVSEVGLDRLRPKVEEILSLLREYPPLGEALIAYFEHDLDVSATAGALHLHPNSLRYRLARLEKLLGVSLKDPATIATLYIVIAATSAEERIGAAPNAT